VSASTLPRGPDAAVISPDATEPPPMIPQGVQNLRLDGRFGSRAAVPGRASQVPQATFVGNSEPCRRTRRSDGRSKYVTGAS
jgi:hypothetical protein